MRKINKKIVLAVVLTAVLNIFLCVSVSAFSSGYYTYDIIDSQAVITSVNTTIKDTVTIPARLGGNFVVEIKDYAFKGCTEMISVTITDNITVIGDTAFWGCVGLENITVSAKNESFCDSDGILFNKERTTLLKYPLNYKGETYIVSESVTLINNSAFSECNRLKRLTILNPYCDIYDSADTIDADVVICAPKNSFAHKYAEKYNREFEVYCLHNGKKTIDKIEPSCENYGYTAGVYCDDCETYLQGHEEIKPIGHKWNSGESKRESTCKTNGYVEYTCLNDSAHKYAEKLPLDINNHEGGTYIDNEKRPGCTETGYSGDTYCEGCNSIKSYGTVIDILGHDAGDAVIENRVIVTCERNGSFDEVIYCKRCKEELSRVSKEIPSEGHLYMPCLTATASTDGDGEIMHVCDCGESFSEKISRISSLSLSCIYYKYDGKNKTPKLTVKDANGKALIKNRDYKITVASRRSTIGRYTVKVNFIGNYSGSKNIFFYVLPGEVKNLKVKSYTSTSVTLKWDKVTGASSYKVYRYSPSRKSYVLAVTTTDITAVVDKLYKATVYDFKVVTCGKTAAGKSYDSNGYTVLTASTCTATPTVRLACTAKGRATIAWKDVKGETGYQVFYSNSESKGFKKISNFKSDTIKTYKTGLVSGETYYFKVRTYIKTDGGYVYSPFSDAKSLTIK